jgi:retinol-binding protein 3
MRLPPSHRLFVVAAMLLVLATTARPQFTPMAASGPALPVLDPAAIPATPAGAALREWLAAFNSGDSTSYEAFLHARRSEEAGKAPMGFLRNTGGFDLISIERSEPRLIEFVVRKRNRPTVALGTIELVGDEPVRLVGPSLLVIGPNIPPSAIRIDADTRTRVVERAIGQLDSFYVYGDVARRMGDSVRLLLARGAYDRYSTGPAFAQRLAEDLTAVSHDKHLGVRFSARALPPLPREDGAPQVLSPELLRQRRGAAAESNCDFQKVERLEGNVGYLKFDGFDDPEYCAETVAAAMTFLSGTRALIVDLRENGGGRAAMVSLILSYLFDTRTHLNDIYTRATDRTEEFWTRDSVAGRRFGGGKPVYVLTSSSTFSAAEDFAYSLKTLKRATIVGETTGGGAHPVRARPIDDHFFIRVPFARSISPVTKTNWEGTGVVPDVKVAASAALDTARKMIGEPPRP